MGKNRRKKRQVSPWLKRTLECRKIARSPTLFKACLKSHFNTEQISEVRKATAYAIRYSLPEALLAEGRFVVLMLKFACNEQSPGAYGAAILYPYTLDSRLWHTHEGSIFQSQSNGTCIVYFCLSNLERLARANVEQADEVAVRIKLAWLASKKVPPPSREHIVVAHAIQHKIYPVFEVRGYEPIH